MEIFDIFRGKPKEQSEPEGSTPLPRGFYDTEEQKAVQEGQITQAQKDSTAELKRDLQLREEQFKRNAGGNRLENLG